MSKKYYSLLISACALLGFLWSSSGFADTTHSIISGEIISGELSMETPNNLEFRATLNGKKQTIELKPIESDITDYRGRDEGWQLTVNSPNFDAYNQSYQLLINGQLVSKSETIVYKNNKQALHQAISMPVKAEISSQAKAGSYGANLEWNLQPNIKNSIKE
ncbi:WxL domain-containing protein [Lactococcus lactis]|uniref:WxL domain-containing protein n=1 Tax=Lactococcus lactis TaxID=1358 RepID=UPI001D1895B8|nr:WxL domain-containing protein [Lactococcus lactis]MCC4122020.1 WxL domain-containing protein [Lactococcus lactis]